jgi:N-acetylneuraminate synthase
MIGMAVIEIGGRLIGSGQPCFIIAEAGVNHNGDARLAYELIDAAVHAGADAVKFQTFNTERVISRSAPKADYQLQTTDTNETQFEMVRRLELSADTHRMLANRCRERGIQFLSSPFDWESVDLLNDLEVPAFKIASGEITNWPLLKHVAKAGKPMIISTGMSYLGEVEAALDLIRKTGNDQIILLHCVSSYPADAVDVNLRAMLTMADKFRVPVGYSDHTLGIAVAIAAASLGACVIEKHLTLSKQLPGPDHRASLEPLEFATMVSGIRAAQAAIGSGEKKPVAAEQNVRLVARRSLAARVPLAAGTVLTDMMLTELRPGTGISPILLGEVVGRKLMRPVESGELLSWSDFE